MYTHILVPTDGSVLCDNAVRHAIIIARRFGAKITALHVVDQFPSHPHPGGFAVETLRATKALFEQVEEERAKKILDTVKEAAEKAGIECDAVTVTGNVPYEMIVKQAGTSRCDLIVMASHGRRGWQALLGSQTVRVLTHSNIPVLVCR
jgi:nucleotide-binding universal stress UspA family protein